MISSPGRQGRSNCFFYDFAVVIKPCKFYMLLVVIGFVAGSSRAIVTVLAKLEAMTRAIN